MTSAIASSSSADKRNRRPDWEVEFYKNGYPKEIIVIEDTPPPESDLAQNKPSYSVIPAPAPPPNVPVSTVARSKRSRQLAQADNSNKRRRKQYELLPTLGASHQTIYASQHPSFRWQHPPPQPTADKDGHFIVRPGEFLTDRYQMQETLGQGTYGKVVKCYDHVRRTYCAIKIIRAIQKYREASQTEIRVLNTLKENDQLNFNQCIHMLEWFDHLNHVCMVFELLDQSVFDFLKANHFEPFPIHHIQHFAKQLLTSVAFMHELKMIHTDLKPENILLKDHEYTNVPSTRTKRGTVRVLRNTEIILIDFGSATFENDYHSSVVSTRHYRAPEIILGLGWSYPCDIWSIGCILVEFFTGDALFQTHDNLEHLAMMEMVLGKIPNRLAQGASREAQKYFKNGRLCYPTPETSLQSQKYVKGMKPLKNIITPHTRTNLLFTDLLQKMLTFDPAKRISAREALRHPFFHIDFDEFGREVVD